MIKYYTYTKLTAIINNSTKILSDGTVERLITNWVNNYKVSLNVQEHAKNEPFTITKF